MPKLLKLRLVVREVGFTAYENELLKPLMATDLPDFVIDFNGLRVL